MTCSIPDSFHRRQLPQPSLQTCQLFRPHQGSESNYPVTASTLHVRRSPQTKNQIRLWYPRSLALSSSSLRPSEALGTRFLSGPKILWSGRGSEGPTAPRPDLRQTLPRSHLPTTKRMVPLQHSRDPYPPHQYILTHTPIIYGQPQISQC